jgi:lysozyme family protein
MEAQLEQAIDADRLIDALIDREGGFVSHAADKGGPTCFGISEAVARAHGYAGPMRLLPREEAASIWARRSRSPSFSAL